MIRVIYSEEQIIYEVKRISEVLKFKFEKKLRFSQRCLNIICVMKGAFMFTSDLIKLLPFNTQIHFVFCSSYEGTKQTKLPRVVFLGKPDLLDKDVLIIEDIVDTGNTFCEVIKEVKERCPKSITTVSVLKRKPNVSFSFYSLFTISDMEEKGFFVGYGLDFNGKYRNLPYIGVLSEE